MTGDPRSLSVPIDRCKGCLCCHNTHVPGVRVCKHPALEKSLPIVDADYERATVPDWCPAPGMVVLLAGPRPSVVRAMMNQVARLVAEDVSAMLDAGPGPHEAGVRMATGPDDTAARVHVSVQGVAACDRSLLLKGLGSAAAVTPSRRCQRGPCKVMWPGVSPAEGTP